MNDYKIFPDFDIEYTTMYYEDRVEFRVSILGCVRKRRVSDGKWALVPIRSERRYDAGKMGFKKETEIIEAIKLYVQDCYLTFLYYNVPEDIQIQAMVGRFRIDVKIDDNQSDEYNRLGLNAKDEL